MSKELSARDLGVGDTATFRINSKRGNSGREFFGRVKAKIQTESQPQNPSLIVEVVWSPNGEKIVLGGGVEIVGSNFPGF